MRIGRISRRILWSLLGAAALGGGWLFWSEKAWTPCGLLGGVFAPGSCALFARLEGRTVQSLLQTRSGDVLVVSRQSGTAPTEPLRVEILARATGERLRMVEIPELPAESSAMGAALDPAERRLALGLLRESAAVIDLETGRILSRPAIVDAAYLGFEGESRLLAGRSFPRLDRFPGEEPSTRRFDLAAGPEAEEAVSAAEAAPIYAAGLDAALSPDGARLFFALPADREAGILRIGETSGRSPDPERPRAVLQAQTRPGCGYLLPRLLVSAEQEILAAAYDCPRLGEPHAGLAVWDLRDGALLARFPTARGQWTDLLALRGEKALLARRHDAESGSSEIRRLSWSERRRRRALRAAAKV